MNVSNVRALNARRLVRRLWTWLCPQSSAPAGFASLSDELDPIERLLVDCPLAEVLRRVVDDRPTVRP